MGHKNNNLSLKKQARQRLFSMLDRGEGTSKYTDKIQNSGQPAQDKIYTETTAKSYYKEAKIFCDFVLQEHPDCHNLNDARQYIAEWLDTRCAENRSPWTIHLDRAAVNKIYNIHPGDADYYTAPPRSRYVITRSRDDAVRDAHFSESRNAELVNFARGTGLRRSELADVRGRDLTSRDELQARIDAISRSEGRLNGADELRVRRYEEILNYFPNTPYFVHVEHGKGGRERYVPISNAAESTKIVDRMRNTEPDSRVWQRVNSNADIHSYRADYARSIYDSMARNVDTLPAKEVYFCRGERVGEAFDRQSLLATSAALGHSRENIVVNNYLYTKN